MSGVAGALIGLAAGQQPNIAPAKALADGTTTSKGCTTNFIGFGFGLTSEESNPNDFAGVDDTVVRALATGGTVQTPAYSAVSGSQPPRSTLSWATGSAAAIPTNSVAPSITGTAQVGQTLTAVNGTWAGIPTPTYTYSWLVGGVEQGKASTYVCRTADIGKTVVCRVTGRNPVGTLSVNSAATAAVIA